MQDLNLGEDWLNRYQTHGELKSFFRYTSCESKMMKAGYLRIADLHFPTDLIATGSLH